MIKLSLAGLILFFSINAAANPYPDPSQVPHDKPHLQESNASAQPIFTAEQVGGVEVLRVRVDWAPGEKYTLGNVIKEMSGTPALLSRSRLPSPFGSYIGVLKDARSGQPLSIDQVGTGQEYRKLVRAMSFRFPVPKNAVIFEMIAENPQSGVREKVFSTVIDPSTVKSKTPNAGLEVKLLKPATVSPSLKLTLFAEGYLDSARARFWNHASEIIQILSDNRFAEWDRIEVIGVFAPSKLALGAAKEGPSPVVPRDSFLGLYYPYWEKFGRWYHVIYPTSEEKFRLAMGDVPYDYPLVLVDDENYWGVGNFKAYTALPVNAGSTAYLLLHEMGHFFGLNEEYEGGGPTELEFASGIEEPWSQNITFLRSKNFDDLKWKTFVDPKIAIPTPSSYWSGSKYGVYKGGYGDSAPKLSHKPGFSCIMDRYGKFCSICSASIKTEILRDVGVLY